MRKMVIIPTVSVIPFRWRLDFFPDCRFYRATNTPLRKVVIYVHVEKKQSGYDNQISSTLRTINLKEESEMKLRNKCTKLQSLQDWILQMPAFKLYNLYMERIVLHSVSYLGFVCIKHQFVNDYCPTATENVTFTKFCIEYSLMLFISYSSTCINCHYYRYKYRAFPNKVQILQCSIFGFLSGIFDMMNKEHSMF